MVCEEHWTETDRNDKTIERESRFAWISAKSLDKTNVQARCNLAARHRWDVEEQILVEKQVYHASHAFSLNWKALQNWYYLLLLGNLINTLALHSVRLLAWVRRYGDRETIRLLFETYAGNWLSREVLRKALTRPPQLRLDL